MPDYSSHQFMVGSIEVVCGPMFSGKTEELIRRVRRAQIARQKIQIFKPRIDDRYSKKNIVSHSNLEIEAIPVEGAIEVLKNLYDSTRIIAIDEVQFFDGLIIKVIKKLARRGVRVICAGLDQDCMGNSFGPMAELLAIADDVRKIQAICTICGASASKTYRRPSTGEKGQVFIGAADAYEARCRTHFEYSGEDEDLLAYTVALSKNDQQIDLGL